MERFIFTETTIIELLLVGIFIALAIRQLNFTFTVALVLVGLAMLLPQSVEVELSPELILALAIPALVFEAARRINLGDVQGNFTRVLVLAFLGVILTTLIVGALLTLFTPLTWPAAVVFAALISAIDPFAVSMLLRNSGVSKSLAVLVESESLINSGIAIVVFHLAITTVLTGQFQILNDLTEFIRVLLGGIVVGLVLGWSLSMLVEWGHDDLIETALTTLLPFGSYLLAEHLHLSGVLAVIAAGLINGNLRSQGTSSRPWEFLAFIAHSLIFLLIGLQVNVLALLGAWQPVLWAIVAVLVARGLVVYGLNGLLGQNTHPVPLSWLHAWNWGGLRGATGMALVLSLPREFRESGELMKLMVFGVVLFTLLLQSTTMPVLLRGLGLITYPVDQLENQKEV